MHVKDMHALANRENSLKSCTPNKSPGPETTLFKNNQEVENDSKL